MIRYVQFVSNSVNPTRGGRALHEFTKYMENHQFWDQTSVPLIHWLSKEGNDILMTISSVPETLGMC